MKLSEKRTKFEPHPEYTGRAVCVDVTPTKKVVTKFGERELFRIVFETDLVKKDPVTGEEGRWCVWSQGFSASLHEKSALRRFLRQWLGRDLNDQEKAEFETESLVGMPAFLVVIHNNEGDETYANLAACTPGKGEALKPCGKYVRVINRDNFQSQAGAVQAPTVAVPKIGKPVDDAPITEFTDFLVDMEERTGTGLNGPWKAWWCTFQTRTDRPATMNAELSSHAYVLCGNDVRVKMKAGKKPGTWELVSISPLAEDDVPY